MQTAAAAAVRGNAKKGPFASTDPQQTPDTRQRLEIYLKDSLLSACGFMQLHTPPFLRGAERETGQLKKVSVVCSLGVRLQSHGNQLWLSPPKGVGAQSLFNDITADSHSPMQHRLQSFLSVFPLFVLPGISAGQSAFMFHTILHRNQAAHQAYFCFAKVNMLFFRNSKISLKATRKTYTTKTAVPTRI